MYRPVNQPQVQAKSVKNILFSQTNYDTLQSVLVKEFEKRNNASLNNKELDRLSRTIDHYARQVYSNQGEQPIQYLNKEILTASAQDFSKYIQRKDATVNSQPVKTVMDDTLFQDTAQRFERITSERNEVKALPPPVPDFRIPLNEDAPSSVELFERAKKQREADALKNNNQMKINEQLDQGLQRYVNSSDMFSNHQQLQNRQTELALIDRTNNRIQHMTADTSLAIMPDRRELLKQPIGSLDVTLSPPPRDLGNANSNPTIIQPATNDPLKDNLSQNYVVRDENTVSYREIENNLFVYSADRNWVMNSKENRYNFTVLFDTAGYIDTYDPSPSSQHKFKNIIRIELVKAVMPGEGLDVLIKRESADPVLTNTNYQDNILNFPFITVRVAELDSNNYGTDNSLDRSFGVLQYDANWISDTTATNTRGYLAMIPKFLKCERVYHPTPLATLQKMTISLYRPNGELVSNTLDTCDIVNVFGSDAPMFSGSIFSSVATPGDPAYFFIETAAYFSRFQNSVGDRIQVGGFTYNENEYDINDDLTSFTTWLNNKEGHVVAGTAYKEGGIVYDGVNSVGYANYIIIQARYEDPTTGSTALKPFAPDITGLLTDPVNIAALESPRRCIDLNKQVMLVFRVITREMDAIGQIRPDNNY